MDFSIYISTPKETPAGSPKTSTLYVTRGLLTGGFLFFPSGPAGTLHFVAKVGSHQILPFNAGENLRLDDCVIPFTLGINLNEPPYQIDCLTWNDSVLYSHALTACFFLSPTKRKKFSLDTLKKAFAGTNGYSKP